MSAALAYQDGWDAAMHAVTGALTELRGQLEHFTGPGDVDDALRTLQKDLRATMATAGGARKPGGQHDH